MQKRVYLLFINLIFSILIASIFSLKINYSLNNTKFTIMSTFADSSISQDVNSLNNSTTYNINSVEIYNSFNLRLLVIKIDHSISQINLIKLNNVINYLLKNKFTNLIYKFSDNTRINIFFINAVIIFIGLLIIYVSIYYLYKIMIKFISLIEIKQSNIKANNYITIIILLLTISLFSFAYFTNYMDALLFFNADELFLIDILTDLKHGGSINNWYLPGAFEFFPDMMILALINLFTKNIYYLSYFYAVIQIVIFYLVITYLFNVFIAKKLSFYLASVLNFINVFFAMNFSGLGLLFVHSFHFQTFIKGLFITTLILNFYKKNKLNHFMLTILTIVQILGIMSDRWLVIWFIMPILCCLAFLYFKDTRFKNNISLTLAVLLIINTIMALVLFKILFIHGLEPEQYFIFQKKAFFHKVMTIFLGDLNVLLIIFFIFVFSISLKYNKCIINFYYNNELFRFLLLLFLALFVLTSLALLVIYYFDLAIRYVIPIIFIAIMLFTFLLYQVCGNYLSLIIISVLSIFMLFRTIGKSDISYEYYPKDIECVDNILSEYHVKHGIGEYWLSRQLNYINKSNVDVVPISLHQHIRWMENEKHQYDNYDFVIIDNQYRINLDSNDIIKLNGKPLYIGKCGTYDIIIYNNGMLKKY